MTISHEQAATLARVIAKDQLAAVSPLGGGAIWYELYRIADEELGEQGVIERDGTVSR